MDYICYLNEQYNRNGFCDDIKLVSDYIDQSLKLIQSFFKILKKLWIFIYFFKLMEKFLNLNRYKIQIIK